MSIQEQLDELIRKQNTLKVMKLDSRAVIPKYATFGSAGFDFHSTEQVWIMPGESAIIPTSLAFEIPVGKEIQIRPRSGMSAKTKIRVSNAPGTIDSDFRGEVKILLDNIGTLPYTIQIGDRIAQGVVCDVTQVEMEEVYVLTETERGAGGLGSTGK